MQQETECCPVCYAVPQRTEAWHDIHQCKHVCCNQCMPQLLDKHCPLCRACPSTRYIFKTVDNNYVPDDTFVILQKEIIKIRTRELRSRKVYYVKTITPSDVPPGEGFLVTEVDNQWVFFLTRNLKSAFDRMTADGSWPEY